ncbi:Gldg family protein [Maioricimonas sp. JC845]|uniref:Gldg family protein n=1 Tax=Maioricimonas sp. JC845 TaxID=3232138 RepID=UPI0034586E30
MRSHVILAVLQRNVASYFSGVLGYLFIVVFVVAGAFLAFNSQFFADNLATLDQLSEQFPLLLLFIVPAITMTVWSDEKKLGTDELLFTLPATDTEILIGKYLSVLGVYTVALLFSVTHAMVLTFIGNPDWGLIATTYLGYWVAGAALLSAGMFASVLTSSATVAFVLGAAICSIPILLGEIPNLPDWLRALTVQEQFRDFALGTVPLSGLLYFVSLTLFMLYLNAVLIGRRHWGGGPDGGRLGWQFVLRVVCLAATLISVNYMAAKAGGRIDMTSEKLYSLAASTTETIDAIPAEKPVTIQAYISPEVPQEYLPVRKKLIGLLRQFDREGGSRLQVRQVDVEPFSEEADEAAKWGIEAREVQSERDGRITVENIFLGAVVTSGFDEVVIPFFDVGTSVEYELTRSIGTVSNAERPTVGILTTDARVTGGFDSQTFRSLPEWRIVSELEKQYNVKEVSPDSPIEEDDLDVLIAVLPSSLTQDQMNNFLDYVRTGKPVLIFDDPLPVFGGGRGFQFAPLREKPRPGGPMGMQAPAEQKADGGRLTQLMNLLESAWERYSATDPGPAGVDFVVFDQYNPHPQYSDVFRAELVFITPKSGNPAAFNPDSPITSGLQELIAWFPGSIRPRANSNLEFIPLLRTGSRLSGLLDWDEVTTQMPLFGLQIEENPPRVPDQDAHVLAAHIRSKDDADTKINVVFVADTDLVSDQFFRIQESRILDLNIDNVTFVLNAVDALAGNEQFIDLRKRRSTLRTLERVERQKDTFKERLNEQIQAAEAEAQERLEAARERLQKRVDEISNDTSLDPRAKQQLIRVAEREEQTRFDDEQREIERAKNEEIRQLRADTQREIRKIENRIWRYAVFLPPIPAILLGVIVLSLRMMNEQSGISQERLVKK